MSNVTLNVPDISSVLGGTGELNAFLFGGERTSLEAYRPLLTELQSGVCFYCQRSLGTSLAVDHFIPWSRSPADLGHNFVLAHAACNVSKADYLPSEDHLEAWLYRDDHYAAALASSFDECTMFTGRSAWRTGHIHRQRAWPPTSGCQAGQSCAYRIRGEDSSLPDLLVACYPRRVLASTMLDRQRSAIRVIGLGGARARFLNKRSSTVFAAWINRLFAMTASA